ncbi:hypothetical protein [Chromobacterium alticapitis]|uniref:Uncharacterized protein n=1 Tax=Chromobacterium alticapitis TaxID=2073169 RepID=A0A2S5DB20_9NEIS|nr:hypothetical protein [Chromobacterium alticapitis]POZ60238.1 hypothetical protein C2I19_19975 [Chromobacterium alticapitis]
MTSLGYAVLYAAGILAVFALFAWKTSILRDRGALVASVKAGEQTFSLARSQIYWWTMLVALVTGWLLILTGNLLSPTPQVLALLGISAGTTGVAGMVTPADASPPVGVSRGWLRDVLDDGQGISVHRYQALLANLGIGLTFVYKSIQLDHFYEIDTLWLGVLGVSSLLYIGGKSQESAPPQPGSA